MRVGWTGLPRGVGLSLLILAAFGGDRVRDVSNEARALRGGIIERCYQLQRDVAIIRRGGVNATFFHPCTPTPTQGR